MPWYSVSVTHFLLTLLLSPFPETFMAVTFLLFDLSCQLLRHRGPARLASRCIFRVAGSGLWKAHRKLTQTGKFPAALREFKMLPFGYVGLSQKIGRSPQSSKTLELKKLLSFTGWSTATQIREFSSYLTGMILPSCK